MQIDWSTIILEIVNFLVLVWILKHFLYQPVLDIIAKRRAGIEATVTQAEETRHSAESLKQQYEGRVADWEQERAVARESLQHELDTERQRRLETLQAEGQSEREKARVADERRLVEAQRRSEQQALVQSARFAAKLLGRLSGPDLETRLVQWMLDEIRNLPSAQLTALRQETANHPNEAEVQSAHPLEAGTRRQIESALGTLFERPVTCRFHEDPALIAGVRITLGPWVLRANLQDELQGFAELSHDTTTD